MRRGALLLVLASLVLAGCGSSSSPSPSGSARSTELSYFAAGTPLVALLATDPNGAAYQNASAFLGRFPFAGLGLAAAESSLVKNGLDFQRDLKPLLGNAIALGTPTSSTLSGTHFLLVFVAKDAGKLAALTQRQPAPRSLGDYEGAKLYQSGSYSLALSGATAVLGRSLADVKSALDLHAHGGGISAGDFAKAMGGLPQNALLQVYGNLAGVLSRPRAAKARLVPWVAAIRSYGAEVIVADTGITIGYRVDTSGGALTASQLPLAPGSRPPTVSSRAPVAAGIRGVAHLIAFVQAAEQAASPAAYAAFLERQAAVGAKTGVDLNKDVFAQFTGNLEVDYGPSGVMVRAAVADPASAARTLSKIGTSATLLFGKVKPVTAPRGGFSAIKTGRKDVSFGLVASQFVAGTATPAQLRAFATEPANPVARARGPLAFRVGLGQLISLFLAARHSSGGATNPLNPVIGSVLGMFGDVTGWAADDPSGLHGAISIPLK